MKKKNDLQDHLKKEFQNIGQGPEIEVRPIDYAGNPIENAKKQYAEDLNQALKSNQLPAQKITQKSFLLFLFLGLGVILLLLAIVSALSSES